MSRSAAAGKKIRTLIVRYPEGSVSAENAMSSALAVIRQGKVSEAHGIGHYCWFTELTDGTDVSVMTKRSEDSADSFFVRKPSEAAP